MKKTVVTETPIVTAPPEAYTISDETIVDNDLCTFRIVRADLDPIWSFSLRAYCNNKTSDTTLSFSMDHVSVNGYMSDPMWAEKVSPGGIVEDSEILLFRNMFQTNGFPSADEIRFTFRVCDDVDQSAGDLVREVCTVYQSRGDGDA